MSAPAYAELHAHSSFSFLDGASAPADLVARAVELGLSALAVTDHEGLYGVVRFAAAAEEAGLHPVIGVEVELADALVPDPAGLVIPARRPLARTPAPRRTRRPTSRRRSRAEGCRRGLSRSGPACPGHREAVKEDHRGVGTAERGPHLVLLARDGIGYRSLCRLVSPGEPRRHEGGAPGHPGAAGRARGGPRGALRLPPGRAGAAAPGRRPRGRPGGRRGLRPALRGTGGVAAAAAAGGVAAAGFVLELAHHLLPGDDWLVGGDGRLAGEVGLPVVVTNDVRYARPEDRELHDVLAAIRHGRSVETLADLRTPERRALPQVGPPSSPALPPGDPRDAGSGAPRRAWHEGIASAGELAAACRVDLGFERYRFPGFPVPARRDRLLVPRGALPRRASGGATTP